MSTTRRINVDVVGSGSSFLAMMNRITAGTTRFGASLGSMNRNAQQSNRWLMAMSTTLRYAFAGRLIFGIQNAVTSLGEFKTQLGQLDALAGRMNRQGQFEGMGSQLDEAGKQALLMSNRFGIAVNDVETYMQRFFSAFDFPGSTPMSQRVKEMNDYTRAVLDLATAIGTEAGDPQKLAGGLTGLINTIPGGRQNPGRGARTISNYFAALLRGTPQLTGADIATAAGRFASVKGTSGMSVQQILATFGVAAQAGGSPSVIIRGITQLLGTSLLHPTKPQSLAAYQAANLPTNPNALAKLGGQGVLERLITFVQAGGPLDRKKNPNFDMIYNLFSRQESMRQFVNLIQNGGVPALRKFNENLAKANKQDLVKAMADTRLRQSLLTRMTNATHNLGISLVSGADWPLENLVARPVIATSDFAAAHPKVTQAAVGGALTIGAANALRRLGGFGRFGRFFGRANAAQQALIGGAVAKEELPSAISGGATDGTRANPFWVIISPLSWSLGSPSGSTSGGGGGGGNPFGFLKKIPPIIPVGAGTAAAGALSAAAVISARGAQGPIGGKFTGRLVYNASDPNKPLNLPGELMPGLINALNATGTLDKFRHGQIQRIVFEGNPKADLTVKLVDSHGRTLSVQEHKGVAIIPKAKTFPSAQGKAGSRKAT